jgi:transcription termination/antitermination protein NusA
MAIQARTEFASALNQVCSERGIEPEVVIDSIKQAILAAYRKDYGEPEGIVVGLDAATGEVKLQKGKKNVTPSGFGRIAAQTAKQVILQRIREAEKNAILTEYSSKVGTIVSGIVQRIAGQVITVNLGKAEGIMPPAEQARNEKYYVNQRLKFYIVGIKEGTRGEEIIVSRSANGLLEGLFKQEVPEIAQGSVEIKTVAREAGSRSKVAVASRQLGVDPVGSCVGQRGVRVQAVINELGDEKIDVIAYQEDPAEFIKAAISPAKDLQVKVNEKEKTAEVTAPDDQLSLAIGKEGQNVRLAYKLTGYKIDIRGKSGLPKEVEAKEKKAQAEAKKALGITSDDNSQRVTPTAAPSKHPPVANPSQQQPTDDKTQKVAKTQLSDNSNETSASEPKVQSQETKNSARAKITRILK